MSVRIEIRGYLPGPGADSYSIVVETESPTEAAENVNIVKQGLTQVVPPTITSTKSE